MTCGADVLDAPGNIFWGPEEGSASDIIGPVVLWSFNVNQNVGDPWDATGTGISFEDGLPLLPPLVGTVGG
jgi:hypothetical protein